MMEVVCNADDGIKFTRQGIAHVRGQAVSPSIFVRFMGANNTPIEGGWYFIKYLPSSSPYLCNIQVNNT